MNNSIKTVAACLLLTASSFAAGPDKAVIPDSAVWAMHFDVAAFTAAELPRGMMDMIGAENSPVPLDKVAKAREVWGHLGKVQSVTLYGPSHLETEAVAVARLQYDPAVVKKLLKIAADSVPQDLAGHEVHEFTAKARRGRAGGQRYLCFYNESTLVASGSLDGLKEAMDLLAGKGSKLTAANALSQMLTPTKGSVMVMAARGVDTLAAAKHGESERRGRGMGAFLQKTDTMRVEIGESDSEVFVSIEAGMKAEEAAQNVERAANGMLGLMLLNKSDDEAVAKVLQSVQVERRESTVAITMQCAVADILQKAQAAMERKAAKRAEAQ